MDVEHAASRHGDERVGVAGQRAAGFDREHGAGRDRERAVPFGGGRIRHEDIGAGDGEEEVGGRDGGAEIRCELCVTLDGQGVAVEFETGLEGAGDILVAADVKARGAADRGVRVEGDAGLRVILHEGAVVDQRAVAVRAVACQAELVCVGIGIHGGDQAHVERGPVGDREDARRVVIPEGGRGRRQQGALRDGDVAKKIAVGVGEREPAGAGLDQCPAAGKGGERVGRVRVDNKRERAIRYRGGREAARAERRGARAGFGDTGAGSERGVDGDRAGERQGAGGGGDGAV